LRQRSEDALPQLDLAGADGGGAVGVDADPGIELAVGREAARQPRRLLRLLRKEPLRIERERDEQRAQSGIDCAPRNLRAVAEGSVHGQVLPPASAARSTARTMRLWVPQRQRLPASAERTSASLGFGVRSSSSLAVMIMPLMQ